LKGTEVCPEYLWCQADRREAVARNGVARAVTNQANEVAARRAGGHQASRLAVLSGTAWGCFPLLFTALSLLISFSQPLAQLARSAVIPYPAP